MSNPSEQPGPTQVTANIKLDLGGIELEAQLTVPTRPTPLRVLLPMVHALTNAIVDAAAQKVEEEGKIISCKKGCGACCRQMVPIAPSEARRLRELVQELPEPRRSAILARFAVAKQRMEAAGLWQKMNARDHLPQSELQPLGLEYFALGVPCPFLEEESCSIHQDRPTSCREYLVTSPAENCSRPSAETIRKVPLPGKVWTALARLDGLAPGARYLRWVPLIQALEHAEANPDDPPDRPGPDWLTELFQYLINK